MARGRGEGQPRHWPLVVVLAVLVAGGIGAAAFLVTRSSGPDPNRALSAAQAEVEDATAFRFTVDGRSHASMGDEEAGSETTLRGHAEGEWSPGRWHATVADGFGSYETVVDDNIVYERYRMDDGSLGEEEWTRWDDLGGSTGDLLDEASSLSEDLAVGPDDMSFADEAAVSVAQSVYLGSEQGMAGSSYLLGGLGGGIVADPSGFLEAIGELSGPVLVDEADGATTVAVTLHAPAALVEAYGDPLPDAQVQLDIGADRLPAALRMDIAQGSAWSHIEIRFSDWNQAIEVEVPPPDEVDTTPWIDEAGLRELTDLALVWPTAPPEGWQLIVYSPAEAADMGMGDDGCETVELDWDEMPSPSAPDDAWDDMGYLYIRLRPADCALEEDPTPFEAGGPAGLPSRPGYFGQVEVLVGETAVDIETSLVGEELDAVAASLAPVDAQMVIDAAARTATIGPMLPG